MRRNSNAFNLNTALSNLYTSNEAQLTKDINEDPDGARFIYDKLNQIKEYLDPIAAWDLPPDIAGNQFAKETKKLVSDKLLTQIKPEYSFAGRTIGNYLFSDIARLKDVAHIE